VGQLKLIVKMTWEQYDKHYLRKDIEHDKKMTQSLDVWYTGGSRSYRDVHVGGGKKA